MKFNDLNANGVKDAGEPGLSGWVINAYADTDGDGILSLAEFTAGAAGTGTTDASGNYSIGGLTPGKYVVCEVLKTSWIQSFPGGADECTGSATLGADGYAITLTSGQTDADNDFGNYQNATKTGMKFQDDRMPTASRTRVSPVSRLGHQRLCRHGPRRGPERGRVHRRPGRAEHDRCQRQLQHRRPDAGQVRRLRGPQGRVDPESRRGADERTGSATLGADGYAITLTSGQTDADNDFGNYQNATKTGTKFQDTNANGVKDAGEPGLATWVINAYADTVPDGVLSVAEFTAGPAGTSTTDASGNYSIGGLTPGKYVVVRGPQGLVDPELPGWCRRAAPARRPSALTATPSR